ncbi:hypothetical protein J3F84DRAFT_362324 [Trichoderma pleuroticola]
MQISLCSVLCDTSYIHPPSHLSRFTHGRVPARARARESTFYPPPSAAHMRSHHT